MNYKNRIQIVENFNIENYAVKFADLPMYDKKSHDEYNSSIFQKDNYLGKTVLLENGSRGNRIFEIYDPKYVPKYVAINSSVEYNHKEPISIYNALLRAYTEMEKNPKGVEFTDRELSTHHTEIAYDLYLISKKEGTHDEYVFLDVNSNTLVVVENSHNCGGDPYISVILYLPNNNIYSKLDMWDNEKHINMTSCRDHGNNSYHYTHDCEEFMKATTLVPKPGVNYAPTVCEAMGWDY